MEHKLRADGHLGPPLRGKNWIEGATEQGEWAMDHEALVIKAKWRKSGGCAAKECVLTWGDLALCLKGRRW